MGEIDRISKLCHIKEKIYESFARNQSIKNTLKRLLLNLLTNNEKGKNEKYLNVLKEKEKFQERAKIYEKKLQNAISRAKFFEF